MMKCDRCKLEVDTLFTSNKNKSICKECLEKEIYSSRKKILIKEKNKKRLKIMDKILMNVFIIFCICYMITMLFMLIKEFIK